MGKQTKNMLIGLFVILACAVIVWLILFLKPGVGDGKQTLYVRFSNVNRINIGTRVLFAGRPVGEVVAIDEIYDARKKPQLDETGRIYFYQLVLSVDSTVKVYTTDEVTIQTSGLLGEKSIAIIPKTPPKGVVPERITNQPIYAESVDPIENAFMELSDLAGDMRESFQQINTWFKKNSDELGTAITSFRGAMDEVKTAVHSVNQTKIIENAQTMIKNASCAFSDVQKAVSQMNDGKVFVNAGTVMKNMKSATHSINQIAQDIANGTGTIGKLIKGDDLYLRMIAISNKVDTLMNDINHYGILFHLNKTWQRQRMQRITTLNALDTAQNFKNYFETEVDEINTAMSRISLLIDKAQLSPKKDEILSDAQFRKDFAELLRQADSLSDTLKLYNEQLTQAME